jgi:hypothetical protein
MQEEEIPSKEYSDCSYLVEDCFFLILQSTMVIINLILVDVGHYAVKWNKLWGGLTPYRYKEGYNFRFPFIELPIIFNVQTR